jgi:TRAP-type C4-dicarboxylate transport system substrate-binding protein
MGKKLLLMLILGVFLVSAVFGAKYTLRFGHVLAPGEPYHQVFLKWAKAVEEKTNGDVRIEVFPSSQLGVEEDIIEQIRMGHLWDGTRTLRGLECTLKTSVS